ncbi:MAG: MFS transporter, partial [Actinomycetota bacterium]
MLRRIVLGVVLAATMASSTFAPVVFSVLATPLRAEFDAARWQIGALVTVVTAVGALISPSAGSITDSFAPRHSTAATLTVAGVGFLAMGAAPGYLWLAAASVLCGVAQAVANPATNRLIMALADTGRRGFLSRGYVLAAPRLRLRAGCPVPEEAAGTGYASGALRKRAHRPAPSSPRVVANGSRAHRLSGLELGLEVVDERGTGEEEVLGVSGSQVRLLQHGMPDATLVAGVAVKLYKSSLEGGVELA